MFNSILELNHLFASDQLFKFCAWVGTGMCLIQFALNLIGLGGGEDFSEHAIEDAGNFKWLSRQAIAGFLMMFGWTALACKNEFELTPFYTLLIASTSGIITIFITGCLFKMALGLQSTGTIFRIEDTLGKEAMVYQRIPKNGIGKIQVSLDSFTREVDATAEQDFDSFTNVKIIKIINDRTVIVTTI